MYLDREPKTHIATTAGMRTCVARFHDPALEIGRNVRGLLWVDYDPATLYVVATQRIWLCDDSDAVDLSRLSAESVHLLAAAHAETTTICY